MTRFEYALYGAKAAALRGEDLAHAKLDAAAVVAIRRNANDMTAKQLAEKYGVHYRTIEKVRAYETWAHVSENPPG